VSKKSRHATRPRYLRCHRPSRHNPALEPRSPQDTMCDSVAMPPYMPYPPQQPQFTAGAWMRAIRRPYGYSRADFAKFLSVGPEQLKRWEQKDKLPNKKGRRRTLNTYARDAGLPEQAFQFALFEDD
jgi:hypothetical protein